MALISVQVVDALGSADQAQPCVTMLDIIAFDYASAGDRYPPTSEFSPSYVEPWLKSAVLSIRNHTRRRCGRDCLVDEFLRDRIQARAL
jgi:hypothetical protein